ncbi:MAG: phytoene/squalene synthase family protein [Patescibacteria group bacterium]
MSTQNLKSDFEFCRLIHKKYGKSYYFATKFFPKDLRNATYALYAFFRLPDEIVDSQKDKTTTETNKELQQFKQQWEQAYTTGQSNSPALRANSYVFKKYSIPYEYSESFLDAMVQDTHVARYATYQDLEKYMYGSASVVGLMMSYVIGFSDKQALEYAKKLGYAMQLTNFLRDIKEDYVQRGRIYMPLDELARFGLREEDIAQEKMSENFVDFMKFQINRTRELFKEADIGIPMLSQKGRFAVKIAAVLYGHILHEIEKLDYNIYKQRARVSVTKKILLLIKTALTT